MAINNTQRNVINRKRELRARVIQALQESGLFPEVDVFEIVGDCDIAFYQTDEKGRKQVFQLSGSFKKNNTKIGGNRESEDVMCDLLDKYDAKLEDRRCKEALAASTSKKSKKKNEEEE